VVLQGPWIEAKSGGFWNALMVDMGKGLAICKENGAAYEVTANSPVPDELANWLKSNGIFNTFVKGW
jgi:hypothetical protein